MNIEYRRESQPELMDKARTRFADEIHRLRALGFSEFCCYTELLPNFSVFTHFPIYFLAKLNRELIRVESPLRCAMSQPLLFHHTHGAYALVFGMGVKFYTLFSDETGVVTANFPSKPDQNMHTKLYKTASPRSIEDAWQTHLADTAAFQSASRQVDMRLRFESYLSISQREDAS